MSLTPHRLARESVPVALVVGFWAVPTLVLPLSTTLGGSFRYGGYVMALLYAVVRGTALAGEADPAYDDRSPEGVLRENARALLGAAPWFVAAVVLSVAPSVLRAGLGLDPGVYGSFRTGLEPLATAFARVGGMVVVLYAVATGVAAVRADGSSIADPATRGDGE